MKAMGGFIVILALAAGAAGCGGDSGSDGPLTIYSGREEELVAPLLEQFTDATGTEVEVRYGDSAELAATIAEEGDNSPADVFFAQDPGSLGSVDSQLAGLPEEILDRVDPAFRDADGRWVGTSGRSRVIVYNTDEVAEDEVPDSVFDLTDPKWKGRIGIAPTNASFQAFVTAMRLSEGDDATRTVARGSQEERSEGVREEHADRRSHRRGRGRSRARQPLLPLPREGGAARRPHRESLLAAGDPGALVSVAGAGVLDELGSVRATPKASWSILLSDDGQRFYVDEAEETEYPLVDGIEPKEGLPPLSELQGPDVELTAFGAELEATIELLRETGYLT